MKYKGIELTEVTEPQIFDPPKEMLVWDDDVGCISISNVCAIVNRKSDRVITKYSTWKHCAEIPEAKQKYVTYRELARWLAEGHGEVKWTNYVCTNLSYAIDSENDIPKIFSIRKWDETEWHKPTREYLGLEDK